MKAFALLFGNCVKLTIVAGAIASVSHCAFAQKTVSMPKALEQRVHLSAPKSSMDEILAMLTKQYHVDILVDDEPLLHQADLILDGTLHDVLDKVADTFDYSWTLSRHGVVLMSKRFRNPNERPQVNLPEMLDMTRNMLKALTLVDYDKDESHWPDLLRQVAISLTPEHVRILKAGGRIRGSDLQPRQKAELEGAILSNEFAMSLSTWEGLLPNIENMRRSSLHARKRESAPNDPADAPTHDYLYAWPGAGGQIHEFEMPHMVYGNNNERLVSP